MPISSYNSNIPPVSTPDAAPLTGPESSVEKASTLSDQIGKTANGRRVQTNFKSETKERIRAFFSTIKEQISTFFAKVGHALTFPFSSASENLGSIKEVLRKIFPALFPLRKETFESELGKEAIHNSLIGKGINNSQERLTNGQETVSVNAQFYKDLNRMNIYWEGKLLMTTQERTDPDKQFEACKKMQDELGEQGLKNLTALMNQASLADELITLMSKYADDEKIVAGLGFEGHALEYRVEITKDNQVKLSIVVDYALAESAKVSALNDGEGIKTTDPEYIVYKREVMISKEDLNINWADKTDQGDPITPQISVFDHISKPSYSYEEAKKAVS
ncbi:hypothetical protein [Candidatus Protochlamydia phocaeensis]|uniref:hypothetical protein n=1 Tax=Candidatus Protochlamydia phocaeensis TaxID=1414722 RepID=UPI00083998DD|nr:hypothetical protein [Candidatus Protochlamydia phocaeensis]